MAPRLRAGAVAPGADDDVVPPYWSASIDQARDEAFAVGHARRERVARPAHGAWDPALDRPDPIWLLEAQDRTRVPALVPIRYGRMLTSPLEFFRGSAVVMASDLADAPTTGFLTQICGDAHLADFGMFASPERDLIFDVNDFDETLPGPWEWDVKRLATSAVLAARAIGLSPKKARRTVEAAVRSYREHMRRLAAETALAVWYRRIDAAEIATEQHARRLLKGLVKRAHHHSESLARSRLLTRHHGHLRFVEDPPLITHGAVAIEEFQAIHQMFAAYKQSLPLDRRVLLDRYEVVDLARKVVGVGSVGTRTFVVLLVANARAVDPLVLQLKEADASVLEAHLPRSPFRSHADRVITGQRIMQSVSDIFLGWSESPLTGVDYYWRQLMDWKGSARIEGMRKRELILYIGLCGQALALAHARGGDRIAIAGYLGASTKFDRAVARFAEAYVDQVEHDHASLVGAVAQGRVRAEPGI